MTTDEILLVNELWGLWVNLAETGEIKIGENFSKSYKKLEWQVNQLNDKRNVAGEEKVCNHELEIVRLGMSPNIYRCKHCWKDKSEW